MSRYELQWLARSPNLRSAGAQKKNRAHVNEGRQTLISLAGSAPAALGLYHGAVFKAKKRNLGSGSVTNDPIACEIPPSCRL